MNQTGNKEKYDNFSAKAMKNLLFSTRGSVIEDGSDDDIDKVRYPHRHTGRRITRDGKRRGHGHEQDIGKTEQQTQSDIQADASPHLA